MRLDDLGQAYMSKVRECTNFVTYNVKKSVREAGPRPSGSQSINATRDIVLPQLEKCADSIERKSVEVQPAKNYAWTVPAGVAGIISVCALLFGLGAAAAAVALAAIILTLAKVGGGKKLTGENVILKRSASGEVKKRVVLLGGIDSPGEYRYNYLFGPKGSSFVRTYVLIGALLVVCGAVIDCVMHKNAVMPGFEPAAWYRWAGLAALPAFIMVIPFVNKKQTVEGVNSNLTGSLACAAAIKLFGDNEVRFENTEVVAVLTDGKYAGCEGAKSCISSFETGVKTAVIAVDTLNETQALTVDTSSKALSDCFDEAAKAADVTLNRATYDLGFNESAPAAKAGFESAVLFAPGDKKYYLTRDDKLDKYNPKSVELAVHTLTELVCSLDEKL